LPNQKIERLRSAPRYRTVWSCCLSSFDSVSAVHHEQVGGWARARVLFVPIVSRLPQRFGLYAADHGRCEEQVGGIPCRVDADGRGVITLTSHHACDLVCDLVSDALLVTHRSPP